ncbi:hypothetical protein BLNAU_6952 [Blattamonas nauphoetae]|uniref:Uncharacterized protein n=1 Tax=Blattamonas nauphoetae TaxID=2049346 RepID=A0ABQ9Y2S2_9EUKA|nr:hypothetical protein BLNAU_6952 [Blattamonas nauphoetae]
MGLDQINEVMKLLPIISSFSGPSSSGIRNTRVFFETGFCESALTFLLTPALPVDVSDQTWSILTTISKVVPLASVETSFPSLFEVLQIHTNNFDFSTTRNPIQWFLISEFSHVILDKTSPNASAVQKCFVRMNNVQKTGEIDARESVEESLRLIDLSTGQDLHPLERLPHLRCEHLGSSFEPSEIILSSLTRLFRLQPTLPTILAEKRELITVCRSPCIGKSRLEDTSNRLLMELASSNAIVARHFIKEINIVSEDGKDPTNPQWLNLYKSKYASLVKHNSNVASILDESLSNQAYDSLYDRTEITEEGVVKVSEEGRFINILDWVDLTIPETDDLDGNAPPHAFARLAPDLIMFIANDNTTVSQAARTAFERVTAMTPSEADVFLTQTSLDIHTAENGMTIFNESHIPTETSLLKQARAAVATVCVSRTDSDEIFFKDRSSPYYVRDLLQLYTCTAALAIFLNPSASSPPPAKLNRLVRAILEFGAPTRRTRDYDLTLYEAEHLLEVIQQIVLHLFTFVDTPTKITLSSVFPWLPDVFGKMNPEFLFHDLVRIGKVLLSEGLSTDPRISRNLLAFFDAAGDETVKTACRSLLTNHLETATSNTSNQSTEMEIDNSARSEELTETDLMCYLIRMMDDKSNSSQLKSLLPLGTYLLWDAEKLRSFQASPDLFLPELLSQVSQLNSPIIASNALNALSHSLDTFPTHFQSTSAQQIVSAVVDTLSSLPKLSTQVFCYAFTLNSFGKYERVAKAAMNCAMSLINSGALDPHVIVPLLEPYVAVNDSSSVMKTVETFRCLEQKTHFTQNKIDLNSHLSHLIEILADVWLCETVNIAKSNGSIFKKSLEWRRLIVPDQCDKLIEACQQRLVTILSSLLKPHERNESIEVGIIASLHSQPTLKIIRFVDMAIKHAVDALTEMPNFSQSVALSRDVVWRCHTLLIRLGVINSVNSYSSLFSNFEAILKSRRTQTSLEPLVGFYAERVLDAIDKVPKERWQFLAALSAWTQSEEPLKMGDTCWRRLVEKVKEEGIEDQLPLNFEDLNEGFAKYLGLNCSTQSQY